LITEQKIPYPSLDTPAVLVDLDTLEANIREMSQLAAEARVRLRPHVKIHENTTIANMQIEAGACGVEAGAVEQAEALAEQGISDIVIAHPNFYGGPRGEILKKLLNQSSLKLALVVDMFEQAEIISDLAQSTGKRASVLIKIDLGRGSRFGVLPGKTVLNLAKKLQRLPGIDFKGIYGHEMGAKPTPEGKDEAAFEAATIMTENARMLRKEGFTIEHVSIGASPTFRSTCRFIKEGQFPEITEIHPGQCVIGDIMYMMAGGNVKEACAVTVLTTVMSTAHPDWAIVDAGYKTFGAESIIARRDTPGFFWNGMPSFGWVQNRPDLWFGRLSAETGCLYYKDPKKKVSFGERLEIVPNNATLVINIHERIYGVRNGVVKKGIPVTGRGRGN
jgi:D-serine deaminase-like pyridoxal phosphate-dependent protein